jgi:predicted phage tail protein
MEQIHENRTSGWEQRKVQTCQNRQWNKYKRMEQPVGNKKTIQIIQNLLGAKKRRENEIWQQEQNYAKETNSGNENYLHLTT